jgi:hypothetical protein
MLNGLDAASNIPLGAQNTASIGSLAAQVAILMTKNAHMQKSIESEMRSEMTQLQYNLGMDIAKEIKKKGELEFSQKMVEAFSGVVQSASQMILQHYGQKKTGKELTKKTDPVAHVDATNNTLEKGEILQGPTQKAQETQEKIPLTNEEVKQTQMEGELYGNMGKAIAGFCMSTVTASLGLVISNKESEIRGMEALQQLVGSIIQNTESSVRSADQNMQAALQLLQQICHTQHEAAQSAIR